MIRLVLRLSVTAIVFAIIFWHIDFRSVLMRLQDLQAGPPVLVVFVLATQFLVMTWRWKRIVDSLSPIPAPYGDLWRALGASDLYGQLLPSTLGSDLIRAAMLARRTGFAPATYSVLVDRITGLAILLALMVALLPLLAWRIDTKIALALSLLGLGGGAGLLIFLFLPTRLPSRWLPPTVAPLSTLAMHTRKALFTAVLAPAVVGGGLFIHVASIALVFLFGRAVGIPLTFLDCLLLVPPALLLAALPVSLAGWGIREGAMASLFALVGIAPADGVTVSILYGLTAPAIGLAYGLFAVFDSRGTSNKAPRFTSEAFLNEGKLPSADEERGVEVGNDAPRPSKPA